ncbi:hypothetical protein FZ832_02045 [Campylobacter jejuni]|uniref:Tetratricopeptide repeat protein n=4 Tax=Campylobacter jejuni TaxID=197 RepID=Q0PBB3_CAMJE|nr:MULTISPECIES: hypothetical protein [Campylobacter]YP_002343834.1 hypothetical protein Cj0397c [Campylobacter jejuni subsp. jejuni NCTC 11168 = ATCC 700819]APA80685.1 hypothetical protein CJD42_1885 [Campylobacter jejuni subsp. jejuni D42a]EAI3656940.1 hypothetical protein [Campylobacter fetus]EFV06070.1 Putative periplasmic protein [Campylobacter jejuni subsp. jejuni DFVF1099]ADC28020.1 conserved hypothetical protein [Campylobacter jejuni subsp. jejuni IA3902]AFU42511.1 hypothetical protei
MGLKDNLKAVKNELNTEEQFIENFIKGERFIRKYKFYISAVVIILVAWFAGNFIISKINDYKTKEANEIYANLIQDPSNKNLLEQLKNKNTNLYAIFLLKENINDFNNTTLQNELKQIYNNAQTNTLLKNIIALSLGDKSIFLKNYDKLLEAYKLLEQNKIEEANVLLSQIKENSSLNQIAKNLKHYQGITQ